MRILAVSDEPSGRLWGGQCREALAGVDLILSAGDLPSSYLSFMTCFTDAPIVYIHGNHDDSYEQKPPEGCINAEGHVVMVKGIRILGIHPAGGRAGAGGQQGIHLLHDAGGLYPGAGASPGAEADDLGSVPGISG